MATIDCNNPRTANERSLCACSESVKNYKRLVDQFDLDKINYASDMASYNRWKVLDNEWQSKSGKYQKWNDIVSSKEHTINKVLGWYGCNNIDNQGPSNHQCGLQAEIDKKYDPFGFYAYESYTNRGGGPCRWRNVRCKRTESSKQKIDNDYNTDRPQSDPDDSKKVWLNRNPPQDTSKPPTYNGVCCSQIIDNIKNSGGDVNLSDISQNCGNSSGGGTPSTNSKKDDDTYVFIGIGSLSLFISCFFMIILLVFII